MITKFKIFEGVRWYKNGKLGKPEYDIDDFDEDVDEYVIDYKGNKIKKEDAVWCNYDHVWCLKKDAIWIDFADCYTTPEMD